ncbi:MAG TPA: hypothetical protein VHB02_19160 [Acidimicrobiales bacterium]|nr:hypothetical protein [Acidimicrobiales bacterium]
MVLVVTVLVVAAAAAARSTWSPCGVSMLSTLTPLGERGRGTRFGTTAAWFVAGAVVGGAALGAVGAAVGAAVAAVPGAAGSTVVALVAAAAALLAAGADLRWAGRRAVGHHRQVNERWLDQFRPWVYGAGFGLQIGCGVATYVVTAGVYLVVVLGGLTGRPAVAVAAGVLFGVVRGLAVLLGRGLDTPEALRRFHARFAAWDRRSRQAMVLVEVAVGATLTGSIPVMAAAVVVAGAVVVAVSVAAGRRRQQVGVGAYRSSYR